LNRRKANYQRRAPAKAPFVALDVDSDAQELESCAIRQIGRMTDRLTYLASPTRRTDEKGDPWLSFGSFWSGIKMRRITL
jgi:hypothetical protein